MAVSNHTHLENDLWAAADELRANSRLRASDYSLPVLGLIFLKYADHKFTHATERFTAEAEQRSQGMCRDLLSPDRYKAAGVLYLPDEARYAALVALPEDANIGKAINDAMKAIEEHNEALNDVLPKTYIRFENSILRALLRIFNGIPMDIEGDVFGKIYEYFLGNFAIAEGQRGGEFFTPTSLVRLIVEIIEPFHGRVGDLACGSGGMFVQSARFVQRHHGQPGSVSVYGQERVGDTVRLCKMNLAVNGLEGDVRQANSYYEDLMHCTGQLDFVMANPPFNVNRIDKERLKNDTALSPGDTQRGQRQLPVDSVALQRAERHGPGGLRDGELRQRRTRLGVRVAQEADPGRPRRCNGRRRLQLLLHGDPAVSPVVPR